jgi:hypothetical protein
MDTFDDIYTPEPEPAGISALTPDDNINTPDADRSILRGLASSPSTARLFGGHLLSFSSTFHERTPTVTFDATSRCLIFRAYGLPNREQLQVCLTEGRKVYGQIDLFQVQVLRTELTDLNNVLILQRMGLQRKDTVLSEDGELLAVLEKDMNVPKPQPKKARISTKTGPTLPKPVPEFKMTVSEYQNTAAELASLRARIAELEAESTS